MSSANPNRADTTLSSAPSPTPQPQLQIVPPGSSTPATIQPEQLPLIRMLEIVRDKVDSLHAGQRSIAEELRGIKTSLPMQRRPLSQRTQSIHIQVTLTRRNGLCPCCQETPVCTEAGRLPGAEYDHFFARDKNRVTQTWLVCGQCNQRLMDTDFKAAAQPAFMAYQAAVRPALSKQMPMQLVEQSKEA